MSLPLDQQYSREASGFEECLTDCERRKVADSWLEADTVDAWRHHRVYAHLDALLDAFPGAKWLTVGDGRFGKDAKYINEHGGDALATNISETLLKEAVAKGLLREYRVENAEKLSFVSGSFDFVLCKESFHHFPRPMVAFYEMLRVARIGVVLIEPHEEPAWDTPVFIIKRLMKWMMLRFGARRRLRTDDTSLLRGPNDMWEAGGNYVYMISEREIEKAAWAMGCPAVAFKGYNDHYEKGVEFEKAEEGNPAFQRTKAEIAKADRICRLGLNIKPYGMLVACVFKQIIKDDAVRRMTDAGFNWRALPRRS